MTGYLLFMFYDGFWHDNGPIFDTVEDAMEERNAMIKVLPMIKDLDYQICPNDGESQKAYRPLDCGDVIFWG